MKNIYIFIIIFLSGSIYGQENTFFITSQIFQGNNEMYNYDMNTEGLVSLNDRYSNIIGFENKTSKNSFEISFLLNKNPKIYNAFYEFNSREIDVKFGKFNIPNKSYISTLSSGHPFISKNSPPILGIDFSNSFEFHNYLIGYNFYNAEMISQDQYLWNASYTRNIITKYIDNPLLHVKSFFLEKKIRNSTFFLKINHGAIWGGTVEKNGRQTSYPKNFEAFQRTVLIRSGIKNSTDDRHKIANHNGSIDLFLLKKNFNIYHIRYFDDESGLLFKNKIDGLWGLELLNENHKVLFEYLSTKNQSGKTHTMNNSSGIDSYYWHDQYVMGWTLDKFSIGNYYIKPSDNRKELFRIAYNLKMKKSDFSIYIDYLNVFNTYGAKNIPDDFNYDKKNSEFYSKLIYNYNVNKNFRISILSYGFENQFMLGSKISFNKNF